MKITHSRSAGSVGRRGVDTFSGSVYLDPVLENRPEIGINDVAFLPGGHTFWHSHERGQVLIVKAGEGYVCTRGGEVQHLQAGDVVHAAPGEEHWHGAGSSTFLVHTAISLGVTTWLEEVPVAEYQRHDEH